jgi:hypothetical protein
MVALLLHGYASIACARALVERNRNQEVKLNVEATTPLEWLETVDDGLAHLRFGPGEGERTGPTTQEGKQRSRCQRQPPRQERLERRIGGKRLSTSETDSRGNYRPRRFRDGLPAATLGLGRRSFTQHIPKEQRGYLPHDGQQAQFGNREYHPRIHGGTSCGRVQRAPQWLTKPYFSPVRPRGGVVQMKRPPLVPPKLVAEHG